MPPEKDGSPLSKTEIALIKRWIEEGARFTSGTGEELGAPPKMTAAEVLGLGVKEPNADAIAMLTRGGATIGPLTAATTKALRVEYISTYHTITDKHIEQLMHIAPNIVERNSATSFAPCRNSLESTKWVP